MSHASGNHGDSRHVRAGDRHYYYHQQQSFWYSVGIHKDGKTILHRPCFWLTSMVALYAVMVTLAVVIPLWYTRHVNTDVHGSRDSAIVDFSHLFCEGLSLHGLLPVENVTGKLYLLESTPLSRKTKLINFSRTVKLHTNYEYWLLHLLPSSDITLTACYTNHPYTTYFYLVKASDNFERWENDASSYDSIKEVQDVCVDGESAPAFFNYTVMEENLYYLIFDAPYDSTTLKVTFNITQKLYNITDDLVLFNCSVLLSSSDFCAASIPISSNITAMLTTLPQEGSHIDWDTNIEPVIKCKPRAWLYATISLAAAVSVAVVGISGLIILYLWYRYVTTNTATSCINDGIPASSRTEGTSSRLNTNQSVQTTAETTPLLTEQSQQFQEDD